MENELKYNKKMEKEEFQKLVSLPLNEKVELSLDIIKEFYENIDKSNGEKCYIACSFGKDSIVLVDLVRKLYPEMPIIFMNSGLEYKGVLKIRDKYENVIETHPAKPMDRIVKEDGYMIPQGKAKAKAIRQARKHISEGYWESNAMARLRGEMGKGSIFNCHTARGDVVAPFPISEKCDYWLKDKANREYRKKHNFKYFFTGLTHDESVMRRATIVRDGFNIMKEKSRPMGHWSSSDVLEYILKNNLELPDSYGEIIKDEKGRYTTSLYKRTGCFCCPAGSHRISPTQYQILYDYDRDAWEYTIYELGFKKVLDYYNIPYLPDHIQEENEEEKNLDDYL